ncbi:hypothetical protein [Mycolicibacterium neworleansense]|uniref:Uncharacterized protein n=1 Tax=Mycolicibacterium neworleansense TaxID=146018 RepID=A0A0H5RKG4_9MYCO|nr:hypothetical protein [Mycolicibacterium neworleansense]MCV7363124.1 hypothetical protein [Mycolicibacterium neworleansense]CRZ13967.1 hypothetical protein BN2156_00811 [Mycolicibacterium neworleansense]
MRLTADGGLWSTGRATGGAPVTAVLEVSGAVLSWVVDGGADEPPSITFTDPERADWLWRVLGEAGHVAALGALAGRQPGQPIELPGVQLLPGSTDALRRLAIGHWLRRWWPASDRDGIGALERPVLDAELALLTAAAEDFFTDDTLDSDAAALLAPHPETLNSLAGQGDPRVTELVAKCRELAGDLGLDWPDRTTTVPRRDDYALAAGRGDGSGEPGLIVRGAGTVVWSAVPPGVFDAAEDTIEWSVTGTGEEADAVVQVALAGPGSAGIGVELRGAGCEGSGVLDAAGRAVLPLRDPEGQRLSETRAWNLDWSHTTVSVGAEGITESAPERARVRAFARARLAAPPADAFLAEIRAAESDY